MIKKRKSSTTKLLGLSVAAALGLVFIPRQVNRADAQGALCGTVLPDTPYYQQYCTGSNTNPYTYSTPNYNNYNYNTATPVTTTAATTQSVAATDNFFSPANITVAIGSTITWTNNGAMAHTVTADNGSFDSGTMNPGGTYSFTFNTAGTFRYYCRFHGAPNGVGMSGIITVTSTGGTVNNPNPVYNPAPSYNYNTPPYNYNIVQPHQVYTPPHVAPKPRSSYYCNRVYQPLTYYSAPSVPVTTITPYTSNVINNGSYAAPSYPYSSSSATSYSAATASSNGSGYIYPQTGYVGMGGYSTGPGP